MKPRCISTLPLRMPTIAATRQTRVQMDSPCSQLNPPSRIQKLETHVTTMTAWRVITGVRASMHETTVPLSTPAPSR